jgi:hypothetical protein
VALSLHLHHYRRRRRRRRPFLFSWCQGISGARFELAVFDEAHVMAGRETKAKKFSFGLDDSRIALERRLFLTATPRTYKQLRAARGKATKAKRKATGAVGERSESTVTAMDNVSAFGPVVYQMTHQQAVKRGIVAPLEILVYNVTDGYADMCRRYPKVRGWRYEVGGWRYEVGGWRYEVRGWRLEVRGWRLESAQPAPSALPTAIMRCGRNPSLPLPPPNPFLIPFRPLFGIWIM